MCTKIYPPRAKYAAYLCLHIVQDQPSQELSNGASGSDANEMPNIVSVQIHGDKY